MSGTGTTGTPLSSRTSLSPRGSLSSRRVLRFGPFSARWTPRTALVLGISAAAVIAITVVSLGVGDFRVSPARVVEILLGGGDRRDQLVIWQIRLPRTLLAIVVGAALALSGAIVQTTARNGLASPDLLGVTAGASAGAVAVIVLGGTAAVSGGTGSAASTLAGILGFVGVPLAALIGGFAAAAIVALILRITGATGLRPLLVGVGISAFFGGLTSWMLIIASIDTAARANVWLTGTLTGRSWFEVATVAAPVVLVALVLVPLATRLPTIELGSDMASSLGVRVTRSTAGLLSLAVVLAAVCASAAGPIGFIALVAPHLARLACNAPRPPLGATALIGAALLLASDLVARTVVAPILLPTGAVTALVGAPFLVWLLVRSRKDLQL
jgi:iron complex transport system permease protein